MAKGAAFEREVCKLLSLWWSGGTNSNVFWRTSNSGGRATIHHKKGTRMKVHCGDVCAIDPVGQPFLDLFAIEMKRGYSSTTIHDLLDKPETAKEQTFEKWIKQAQEARNQAGVPFWMLITRRDRRETLVTIPVEFHLEYGTCLKILAELSAFVEGCGVLVVTTLEEFLEHVHPARLKSLLRNRIKRKRA